MARRKSSSDGVLEARMGGVRIASGLESVVGDPFFFPLVAFGTVGFSDSKVLFLF